MEKEWIQTGNALLDTVFSSGIPNKGVTILSGKSVSAPISPIQTIHQANIVILDGFTVKDRTGVTEKTLPSNWASLKVVFWDPELGLLELSS
jgi:hypothetical protein